ncbi:MAG: GNAT family N-acetyltransferase [Candidatus Omnitrophica bacterium]|nr:GNAT family N-acetyltransferase [Candidatus Omnitrophota bacterium]
MPNPQARPDYSLEDPAFWEKIRKAYDWEAEPFDLTDEEGIRGLLDLVRMHYGEVDEAYPEYLRWEYSDNPAGRAIIWVARHNRRIVGQYVINPVRMKLGAMVREGSLAIKVLTHRDFREKGIYPYLAGKAFAACRQKNIVLTYGFPNSVISKESLAQLGYRYIGSPGLWIKPLSAKNLLRRCAKDNLFMFFLGLPALSFLGVYDFFLHKFNNSGKGDSGRINVRIVREFDRRFDDLWQRAQSCHKNIIVRDSAYLNWRYIKNPRRSYVILAAEDSGKKIVGYTVLRIASFDTLKAGYIVDLLAEKSCAGRLALSLLIKGALAHFRKNGADIAGFLVSPDRAYSGVLLKNGFFICPERFRPQPYNFVLRNHSPEIPEEDVLRFRDWFITFGDNDVV